MTTAAEIKRVVRLTLEREPRLIYHKRLLIVPPVGHYLRAFLLDQTSTKEVFRLCYLVQPLYAPSQWVSPGFGDDLHVGPRWSVKDPAIPQYVADVVLGEGMKRIGHVDSPEAFLEYAKGLEELRLARRKFYIFLTLALLGRFDEARPLGQEIVAGYLPYTSAHQHARRFLRLFDDGPARVRRVLKSWEQGTARRLQVDGFWQSQW